MLYLGAVEGSDRVSHGAMSGFENIDLINLLRFDLRDPEPNALVRGQEIIKRLPFFCGQFFGIIQRMQAIR